MKTEPREAPDTDDPKKLQKWAGTKLSLSLAVTMYFKPPPESCAEGVLKVYQRYLEICEPQLAWFADETGKKYREAGPDVLRIPFDRVPQAVESGKTYTWSAFAGKHHQHAAPFQFFGFLDADEHRKGDMSFLRAAFSVDLFRDDLSSFVELARELSSLVPVFHGVGGYSFSESMVSGQAQTNEPYKIAAAMHFGGVEVESPIGTSLSCKTAIKGVGWLTMLGAEMVKRLGDESEIVARLGEDVPVMKMPWGLLIQAGPAPEVGVVNAGQTLPLYRRVNQVVRPVRVAAHMDFGVEFDATRTHNWLTRLD